MSCLCPHFADRSKICFFFFWYFCEKDLPLFRFEFSLACLVCFRRPAGGQGEEQEDGGGDGGRLPGYPEHVNLPESNHLKNLAKRQPRHFYNIWRSFSKKLRVSKWFQVDFLCTLLPFTNGSNSGSYYKMRWFTRKKSSKPSQTNLTKPLLKCRVINTISGMLQQPDPVPPQFLSIFYTCCVVFYNKQHFWTHWITIYHLLNYHKSANNVNNSVQLKKWNTRNNFAFFLPFEQELIFLRFLSCA
jgi:hypothetical protein